MKMQTWIGIFSVLVFGVGFTVGVITLRVASGSTEREKSVRKEFPGPRGREGRDGWDGRRGREGRDGRRGRPDQNGSMGPYLGSVHRFADELSLSEDQRTELSELISRTTEEVTRHEQGISNLILETRALVQDLLTDEQRSRLDELMQESMRRHSRDHLVAMTEWVETEFEPGEEELAQIRGIFEAYLEAKGEYFRGLRRNKKGWPDHEEMESSLEKFRKERDEKLSVYLSDQELDRFRRVWGTRRPGR
jgi:hypothetical protein